MSWKKLKDWDRESREPILSRINAKLHKGAPLKERITQTVYRLKVQLNRLEGANLRTQQHDRELFNKCVAAQLAKDNARASMYANECAELRKIAKITLRSQLALEQVMLRMETIQEFGDVAALMGPISGVVGSIKSQVSGVLPEVGYELGEIGDTLNSVVMEVGQTSGQSFDFEASSEEASKIMTEANTIAEQRMREKFPELPVSSSVEHVEVPPMR